MMLISITIIVAIFLEDIDADVFHGCDLIQLFLLNLLVSVTSILIPLLRRDHFL